MIKTSRVKRGLTARNLADRAEVSPAWLSRVEAGEIGKPGEERLKRIAHTLRLDPLDLLQAAGALSDEERLLQDGALDVEGSIRLDKRLTESQRRRLIGIYREFTGSSERT